MNEWIFVVVFFCLSIMALTAVLNPLKHHKKTMVMIAPLLISLIALAYWKLGAWPVYHDFLQEQTRHQQAQTYLKTIKGPEELINKLKEKLKQTPDSAQGWYLLGRLYLNQEQWTNARDAFIQANTLMPHDEAILINYAQSLWQINHQQFNDSIRDLLSQVIHQNNNQPDALSMLAIDAFMSHDYQRAIKYWQQLLKQLPQSSDAAEEIRQAIAKARQQIKLKNN